MKSKLLIFFTILSVLACRKLKETPETLATYYPLAIGEYSIFAIQELEHDPFTEKTDTINYWLKETIVDTLRDNTGQLAYKLQEEQSNDQGESWEFIRFGVTHKDENSAQRFVGNIRTVVQSYPLRERKSWDVNELNNQDKKTARYFDIDQEYTIDQSSYTNTLRVDLGTDVDPLFQEVEEEIYARGKGLIKRIKINVETQPNKYKEGNEYIQTIISTNR